MKLTLFITLLTIMVVIPLEKKACIPPSVTLYDRTKAGNETVALAKRQCSISPPLICWWMRCHEGHMHCC